MDRRQKSALRSQHIKIADELILDEDFYAALRRDKIFTNSMLDLIKAEAKPRDRVYKMLELLEKRGPKAFETFLKILQENYKWLADELEEEYKKRLQNQQGHSQHRPNWYAVQQRYTSHGETVSLTRTTSTPNPGSRTKESALQNQGSVSAFVLDKSTQHFFSETDGNKEVSERQNVNDYVDCPDNLRISIPASHEENSEKTTGKKYKDACISPIGVIESQRKKVTANCSPIRNVRFDIKEHCTSETGFDEIRTQTNESFSGSLRETHSRAQCDDFEVDSEDENDVIDGFEHVEIELNEDDADLLPGEEYYAKARRESSCLPIFGDDTYDHELSTPGCEGSRYCISYENYANQNDITQSDIECEHHEALAQLIESIKTLYKKLSAVNSCSSESGEDSENTEEDSISWKMMEDEVDKLIHRLEDSDDMKMIQKCQAMFPEKDRRYPLNVCIENLNAEKKEVENKLRDKQKEVDQMVFDLWKHQQDMSSIRKLKQANVEMSNEIENLKASLANLEKDGEIKLKFIELKDNKIKELESKVKETNDDKIKKQGPRRSNMVSQRRTSNAQGQSPRRMNANVPSFADPRALALQGAYSMAQQSPRSVAPGFLKAPATRK